MAARIRYSQVSTLIATISDYAGRARREGILSLQYVANECDDPFFAFFAEGIRLVVDGVEGHTGDPECRSPAYRGGRELSPARAHAAPELLRARRIPEGRLRGLRPVPRALRQQPPASGPPPSGAWRSCSRAGWRVLERCG